MKLQKKEFYLIIVFLCFMVLLINIPYADATTFSKTLNTYFLNNPPVTGYEHYEFNANYEHGYGVWNVYHDYYWCTVNTAGTLYCDWHLDLPEGTQYYNGNLLIYNTQGTRTPYQGSGYYPGDVMLFNSIANFSTYTPSGNSLGEAYSKVTFYNFLTQGQYGFSLDMGINF